MKIRAINRINEGIDTKIGNTLLSGLTGEDLIDAIYDILTMNSGDDSGSSSSGNGGNGSQQQDSSSNSNSSNNGNNNSGDDSDGKSQGGQSSGNQKEDGQQDGLSDENNAGDGIADGNDTNKGEDGVNGNDGNEYNDNEGMHQSDEPNSQNGKSDASGDDSSVKGGDQGGQSSGNQKEDGQQHSSQNSRTKGGQPNGDDENGIEASSDENNGGYSESELKEIADAIQKMKELGDEGMSVLDGCESGDMRDDHVMSGGDGDNIRKSVGVEKKKGSLDLDKEEIAQALLGDLFSTFDEGKDGTSIRAGNGSNGYGAMVKRISQNRVTIVDWHEILRDFVSTSTRKMKNLPTYRKNPLVRSGIGLHNKTKVKAHSKIIIYVDTSSSVNNKYTQLLPLMVSEVAAIAEETNARSIDLYLFTDTVLENDDYIDLSASTVRDESWSIRATNGGTTEYCCIYEHIYDKYISTGENFDCVIIITDSDIIYDSYGYERKEIGADKYDSVATEAGSKMVYVVYNNSGHPRKEFENKVSKRIVPNSIFTVVTGADFDEAKLANLGIISQNESKKEMRKNKINEALGSTADLIAKKKAREERVKNAEESKARGESIKKERELSKDEIDAINKSLRKNAMIAARNEGGRYFLDKFDKKTDELPNGIGGYIEDVFGLRFVSSNTEVMTNSGTYTLTDDLTVCMHPKEVLRNELLRVNKNVIIEIVYGNVVISDSPVYKFPVNFPEQIDGIFRCERLRRLNSLANFPKVVTKNDEMRMFSMCPGINKEMIRSYGETLGREIRTDKINECKIEMRKNNVRANDIVSKRIMLGESYISNHINHLNEALCAPLHNLLKKGDNMRIFKYHIRPNLPIEWDNIRDENVELITNRVDKKNVIVGKKDIGNQNGIYGIEIYTDNNDNITVVSAPTSKYDRNIVYASENFLDDVKSRYKEMMASRDILEENGVDISTIQERSSNADRGKAASFKSMYEPTLQSVVADMIYLYISRNLYIDSDYYDEREMAEYTHAPHDSFFSDYSGISDGMDSKEKALTILSDVFGEYEKIESFKNVEGDRRKFIEYIPKLRWDKKANGISFIGYKRSGSKMITEGYDRYKFRMFVAPEERIDNRAYGYPRKDLYISPDDIASILSSDILRALITCVSVRPSDKLESYSFDEIRKAGRRELISMYTELASAPISESLLKSFMTKPSESIISAKSEKDLPFDALVLVPEKTKKLYYIEPTNIRVSYDDASGENRDNRASNFNTIGSIDYVRDLRRKRALAKKNSIDSATERGNLESRFKNERINKITDQRLRMYDTLSDGDTADVDRYYSERVPSKVGISNRALQAERIYARKERERLRGTVLGLNDKNFMDGIMAAVDNVDSILGEGSKPATIILQTFDELKHYGNAVMDYCRDKMYEYGDGKQIILSNGDHPYFCSPDEMYDKFQKELDGYYNAFIELSDSLQDALSKNDVNSAMKQIVVVDDAVTGKTVQYPSIKSMYSDIQEKYQNITGKSVKGAIRKTVSASDERRNRVHRTSAERTA